MRLSGESYFVKCFIMMLSLSLSSLFANAHKVFVPDLNCRLHGVSIRVPQFEVRWRFTQDASLVSNRLPEKMMSDSANKSAMIQQFVFSGMSVLMEVVLCRLLIFNYI